MKQAAPAAACLIACRRDFHCVIPDRTVFATEASNENRSRKRPSPFKSGSPITAGAIRKPSFLASFERNLQSGPISHALVLTDGGCCQKPHCHPRRMYNILRGLIKMQRDRAVIRRELFLRRWSMSELPEKASSHASEYRRIETDDAACKQCRANRGRRFQL